MAKFELALANTLGNEGTYSNVKGDTGGETYKGIARNKHPEWSGWKIIDGYKALATFPKCLESDGTLQASVKTFYASNGFWFWDDVTSQEVANKIFDIGVNDGPGESILLLQRSINYIQPAAKLPTDGKFSDGLVKEINAAYPESLMQELRARMAWYYAETFAHKPDPQEKDLEKFILGWMRRAVI